MRHVGGGRLKIVRERAFAEFEISGQLGRSEKRSLNGLMAHRGSAEESSETSEPVDILATVAKSYSPASSSSLPSPDSMIVTESLAKRDK